MSSSNLFCIYLVNTDFVVESKYHFRRLTSRIHFLSVRTRELRSNRIHFSRILRVHLYTKTKSTVQRPCYGATSFMPFPPNQGALPQIRQVYQRDMTNSIAVDTPKNELTPGIDRTNLKSSSSTSEGTIPSCGSKRIRNSSQWCACRQRPLPAKLGHIQK